MLRAAYLFPSSSNLHTTGPVSRKPTATLAFILAKKQDILVRYFSSALGTYKQLVVSQNHRNKVLCTTHDSIPTKHQGTAKTLYRIQAYFCWPGMSTDVKRYCKSCPECQKMTRWGSIKLSDSNLLPILDHWKR